MYALPAVWATLGRLTGFRFRPGRPSPTLSAIQCQPLPGSRHEEVSIHVHEMIHNGDGDPRLNGSIEICCASHDTVLLL